MTRASSSDGARDEVLRSGDPRTRLEAWQSRLESHFALLAVVRRDIGWPVFALEHGLSAGEREALMRDVQMYAAVGLDHDIYLPWVVYAAEIGYEYSGYEYWRTFALKTPKLDRRHFTSTSSLFSSFAERFHGAVPDGRWAHFFKHIAWPITHGILPQDLQRQLAELLYYASMSFRMETFSSAEALGLHLQARSSAYSSRFRQFAENATLLGQISLALLLQDAVDALGGSTMAVLHPNTLSRIVDDLNRERDARQWLADARSAARFRIRGLSRIPLHGSAADSARSTDSGSESVDGTEMHSRPHFLLREEASERWQVRLQLPNLAHLAARSPRSREVLTHAQGRVAGSITPVLATSRIIREGAPTVRLSRWPAPHTQLLTFDGAPPELSSALHAGFRLGVDDRWLFSIRNDGQARELKTRVLRAGASYILLQKTETRNPAQGLGLRPVTIACNDIYGLRLDVPKDVSDDLVNVLAILGLEVTQTLEVWPVGLPAAQWSNDGQAEWVVGHPIILGVRTDHQLTGFTITIDELRKFDVEIASRETPGAPSFIQLPYLAPGPHRLAVVAHTTTDGEEPGRGESVLQAAPPELRGELHCLVREPRTAAIGQVGALSFSVLPSAPSLEDVWEGRIEVHVAAPGCAALRGSVVLRGLEGEELFKGSLSLPSPCDTPTWRSKFAVIRKAADAEYDNAQLCILEFDAGALGRGRITAERDFTPLRWAIRANGHQAALVDSQGCADLLVCTISCAAPSLEESIDSTDALDGIAIPDGGALVVARSGTLEAATVVIPPQHVTSLSALSGERPQVPVPTRDAASLLAMSRTTALWERARLAGNSLAAVRRASVVKSLVARLTSVVAGGRWAEVEEVLSNQGPQVAADMMRGLVANRPDERAVATVLASRVASTAGASVVEADRVFLDALTPFIRMPNLEVLAAYALRLAASPVEAHAFHATNAGEVHELTLIDHLLVRPVVLRAARYFVVATRMRSIEERDDCALPWESR